MRGITGLSRPSSENEHMLVLRYKSIDNCGDVPVEISRGSSLKFGWTENKRPDYEVKLRLRDLEDIKNAVPKDEFVAKVGEKLVGDDYSSPRFVLLS